MGRVEGKVAFITGAARGQGRSHAVRLAEEGADIIAIDICGPIRSSIAEPSTPEDLAETVRLVEGLDRRIVARQADVRNVQQLKEVLDEGVAELGHLDIVATNAGIWNYALGHEITEEDWTEVVDIVLTGAWHTCKVAIPYLIAGGNGGSIAITSSAAGFRGYEHVAHYVAAKTGVVGLMRTLANELGKYMIRVNTIHPGAVDTALIQNKSTYELFCPEIENPTQEEFGSRYQMLNVLPIPWVQPRDISNALLFLASDEARYITGVSLPVDAGTLVK